MMGIIDQAKKERGDVAVKRYRPPSTIRRNNSKILETNELKRLICKTLDSHLTSKEGKDNYRKFTLLHNWRLASLLDRVDEGTFCFMVSKIVEHAIDTRTLTQGNGHWRLYDYEVAFETRETIKKINHGQDSDGNFEIEEIVNPEKFIVIGIMLVDIKNQPNIKYSFGRPVGLEDGNQDVKEIAKILKAQNQAMHGDVVNEEQQMLIDEQQQKLAAQQAQLDEQQQRMEAQKNEMDEMRNMMKTLISMQTQNTEQALSPEPEAKAKPKSRRTTKK